MLYPRCNAVDKALHFVFGGNCVGLLQERPLFPLRKIGKALHGIRVLCQCEAEAKGKIVSVHGGTSKVFQIRCRNVVFQIVSGKIVVNHGVGI